MFTGIIQGRGKIARLAQSGKEARLAINALFQLEDLVTGESIAVNGACLTVESAGVNSFTAYASAETMSVTNLRALRAGSTVNLERALSLGDRLGGHLVSGHVDCMAKVEAINSDGESKRIRLSFPARHSREIIPKGSVALDGVSLTINDCGLDFLEVNVIPETWSSTTIAEWAKNSQVNMETDLIGKYVCRALGLPGPQAGTGGTAGGIDENFLKQNGFF